MLIDALFNQLHSYGDNIPQNVISLLTEAANKELKSQSQRKQAHHTKTINRENNSNTIQSLNDDGQYITEFIVIWAIRCVGY